MQTFKKTLLASSLLMVGAAAQAEVSGSVGIASSYLWRGFDLSGSSAVVSGSLDYAHESGIYAGIWGSSGDDTYGTEYDLYLGWGGDVTEDFSVDIGYVDYNYPTCENLVGDCGFEEVIVGAAYGPVSFTVVEPTTSGADYNYFAAGVDISDFNITIGGWSGDDYDGQHIDLTYSIGDLAFTFSKADGDSYDASLTGDEVQFVVSYSIPLE